MCVVFFIVMGDFNAKIGVRNTNDKMKCTGPFGTDNRNERGERSLDFAEENEEENNNITEHNYITDFPSKLCKKTTTTSKELTIQAKVLDMALELSTLHVKE